MINGSASYANGSSATLGIENNTGNEGEKYSFNNPGGSVFNGLAIEYTRAADLYLIDRDNDGMSDGWENDYNFDPFDDADAGIDGDGDGYTNLEEYVGNSDPLDINSVPIFILGLQENDIRLDTDIAGSESSLRPKITGDNNGHLYTVWYDHRNGNSDIYFNRSSDYGITWLANDIRLGSDTPGAKTSFSPQIACDINGNVYVVWYDYVNGNPDIYFNYSSNFGTTWQANNIRLNTDTPGSNNSSGPQIACDNGGHVYVVWQDRRSGSYDIYANHSLNYGVSWQANDYQLSTHNPGSGNSYSPDIDCNENGNIYVTWYDNRNGNYDIYFSHSTNYGMSWDSANIRLDTDGAGSYSSYHPKISSDSGGHVYVTWRDYRNGGTDIYFNRSGDYGNTWMAADIRLNTDPVGANYSFNPEIANDDPGHVYVTWYDGRNGNFDIYVNISEDYGNSWQNTDTRLDSDEAGQNKSYHPQISTNNNGKVFVTWYDNRNGGYDIYANFSEDFGINWSYDIRLGSDEPGSAYAYYPSIYSDNANNGYIVWYDSQNGARDIFFHHVKISNLAATESITLIPPSISLGVTLSVDYFAQANLGNGFHSDITPYVTWNSNTPAVATVTPDGRVTAVTLGTSQITAEYDGIISTPSIVTVPSDGDYVFAATIAASITNSGSNAYQSVPIGFNFIFYGNTYSTANISTEGFLSFGAGYTTSTNQNIPSTSTPNNIIAPFWDSLNPSSAGDIYYETIGTAPNRTFVAEWRNITQSSLSTDYSFEVQLDEGSNSIRLVYGFMHGAYADGSSATVGIENSSGTDAVLFSYNQNLVSPYTTLNFLTADGGTTYYLYNYIAASNMASTVSNSDDSYQSVPIGFTFPFFGNSYSSVYIGSNGFLSFGIGYYHYSNQNLPSTSAPNNMIAPFWDDLNPRSAGDIYYETVGVAPNRIFVAEWRHVTHYGLSTDYNFQVQLFESSNAIQFIYDVMNGTYADGGSATIGIENSSGTSALLNSYNQSSSISPYSGISIRTNDGGSSYYFYTGQ